jgi:hypothetical protein
MVRRHTPRMRALMAQWRAELSSHGHVRDQLSLAPLLFAEGVRGEFRISRLPGHGEAFQKCRCHKDRVLGETMGRAATAAYCAVYHAVKCWAPRSFEGLAYGPWHAVTRRIPPEGARAVSEAGLVSPLVEVVALYVATIAGVVLPPALALAALAQRVRVSARPGDGSSG